MAQLNFTLAFVCAFLFSLSSLADLKSDFQKLSDNRKGAFSLNYLQYTQGRILVNDTNPPPPPGVFQFQAAYRNDDAKALAVSHDFYVGNLFSTNYYELMGQYVFGDAYGSHVLDAGKLKAVGSQAQTKTFSMVRHWVLEKYYMTLFPTSALALGYNLRGISGAEFEQEYSQYFFDFCLSLPAHDSQFLPLSLLAKGSPLVDSASLEKVRTQIAALYDALKLRLGDKDAAVKDLYTLRNIIHNQLQQSVIVLIDSYLAKYPQILPAEKLSLQEMQTSLKNYYSVTAARVAEIATSTTAPEVRTAALTISMSGFNPQNGLALSLALAKLRLTATSATQMALITTGTRFLNAQYAALGAIGSKEVIKAVINLVFAEGFLIKDNWLYFSNEIDTAADVPAATLVLSDVVEIANDTLLKSFSPSLNQWISVEPRMLSFVDNAIKSSSLNTASVVISKTGQ